MTHRITQAAAIAAISFSLNAAPRTLDEARREAELFLTQRLGHAVAVRSDQQRLPMRSQGAQSTAIYNFCDEASGSQVLVSGSDLLQPILGYTIGVTDANQMPDALKGWMEGVAQAIEALEGDAAAQERQAVSPATYTPIDPLITTRWDQGEPYNLLCPKVNGKATVTGCMATAMAQVINYWKYPNQGKGSNSYTDRRGNKHDVDFSQQTYDWSLMRNVYDMNASQAERDEVAKLMYHCGVSILMDYDLMSSTISEPFANAFINNFGFSNRLATMWRATMSFDEWNARLIEELKGGRPMMFGAQSSAGGHCFIIDGIDEKGFYHVNWGWSGNWDGFYDINILHTDGVGTGASVVEDGFSISQWALVNVAPTDVQTGSYYCGCRTPSSAYRLNVTKASAPANSAVTLQYSSISTYDSKDESGKVGVLIKQGDKVIGLSSLTPATIIGPKCKMGPRNWEYESGTPKITVDGVVSGVSLNYTPGEDLPDGTYQLYVCFQPDGSEEYDIMREVHAYANYIQMRKEGSLCYYVHPQLLTDSLSFSNWSFETQPLYAATNKITVDVTNAAGASETAVHQFFLYMNNGKGQNIKNIASHEVLTLAPGQTGQISFNNVTIPVEGQWTINVFASPHTIDNNIRQQLSQATCTTEVLPDATNNAIIRLSGTPTLQTATPKPNCPITINATLINSGQDFDGMIRVRLFLMNTSTDGDIAHFDCPGIKVPAGATVPVVITGTPTGMENKAQGLYARLYAQKGSTWTALSNSRNAILVPFNPNADGLEAIKVDDYRGAEVFNILGRRVEVPASGILPAGLYIIDGRKTMVR